MPRALPVHNLMLSLLCFLDVVINIESAIIPQPQSYQDEAATPTRGHCRPGRSNREMQDHAVYGRYFRALQDQAQEHWSHYQ